MSNQGVNQSFVDWFRALMTRAGYPPPDGRRSGGTTRLAKDSGVSLAALSRILNEGRTPSVGTMRQLTRPLHTTLPEMLIRAGEAIPDDFPSIDSPHRCDVVHAIDDDPELDDTEKRALRQHYAGLIMFARQRRQMDSTQSGAGPPLDPIQGSREATGVRETPPREDRDDPDPVSPGLG